MALGNEPRVVAYGADALENLLPLPLTDGGAALKVAVIDGEGPGPAGTIVKKALIGATGGALNVTLWIPDAGKAIVLSSFVVEVPSNAADTAGGTKTIAFVYGAGNTPTDIETAFFVPALSSNNPPAYRVAQVIPMGLLLPVDSTLKVTINQNFSNNVACRVTVYGYEV